MRQLILTLSVLAVTAVAHGDATGKWRGKLEGDVGHSVQISGPEYTLELLKGGVCTAYLTQPGSQAGNAKPKQFVGKWVEKDSRVRFDFGKSASLLSVFDKPLILRGSKLVTSVSMFEWNAKAWKSKKVPILLSFSRV